MYKTPESNAIHFISLAKNNSVQTNMQPNRILIHFNASWHKHSDQSTAAFVVIQPNSHYYKIFDCAPLLADSAARCEMIAAVLSILSIDMPANKEIHVHIDCDFILKTSNKFIVNLLHASSNCSIDQLAHIHTLLSQSIIKFYKVKGHDKLNPNSLNHLVDYLSHFHENALPPPIQVISNFT